MRFTLDIFALSKYLRMDILVILNELVQVICEPSARLSLFNIDDAIKSCKIVNTFGTFLQRKCLHFHVKDSEVAFLEKSDNERTSP